MSLLILRNLLKTFGGLVAMNSVTFSVDEASIVGLIGENGAGKTTLLKILCGVNRADDGTVDLLGGSPTPARSSSIGRTLPAGPPTRSWNWASPGRSRTSGCSRT